MPELPEVEATRRIVERAIVGSRVAAARVGRDRMVRRHSRPGDFIDRITGRSVLKLGRHGKFLLAELEGDLTWVTHLGMSGRLRLAAPDDEMEPHTNVVIDFTGGVQLRFVDPRTFGFMVVYTPAELRDSSLASLGRDALEDLPRHPSLARLLDGRTAPIKALLLDQRLLAGLGNIYADEVLHRAGIAPQRPGGSLDADEVRALRAAVRPVLLAGLRAGGTSLDDLAYLLPDGRTGEYMSRLAVYGRAGERCRRCGETIRRVTLRGRSTHWCPGCQV